MEIAIENIDKFWAWFVKHIGFIETVLEGRHHEDAWVVGKAVDRFLPGLQWEAGPGLAKPIAFTISPDGDPAKLAIAEAVIARAPAMDGWEFHATKPPKRWNFTICLRGPAGDTKFDCGAFRYELTKYGGGKFYDICFYHEDQITGVPSPLLLARLLAEGCLGERLMLTMVGRVTLDPISSCTHRESLSEVQHLSEHFNSCLSAPAKP